MKPGSSPAYFPNLDGLRYIACMAVFVQHALAAQLEPHFPTSYMLNKVTNFLFWSGESGVSFFFVLSGFLITWLLLREQDETGRINVPAFYMRRTLRIWPLFYALVCYSLFVFERTDCDFACLGPDKWKYFFFASNFACLNPGGCLHPVNITWSVSVEEQFYLVWPLLFLLVPRRFNLYIFLLVMGGSLGFRMAHADEKDLIYLHTFALMYDLALGGLCAWAMYNSERFASAFRNMPGWLRVLLYAAGLALLIFGSSLWPTPGIDHIAQRLVNTTYFAFVILDQNLSRFTWLKLSNNRFMSHWGKYTYGMYLLHPLLIDYVYRWCRLLPWQLSDIGFACLAGLAAAVVTHAVCYASYHYYEMPFLKLKKRFSILK